MEVNSQLELFIIISGQPKDQEHIEKIHIGRIPLHNSPKQTVRVYFIGRFYFWIDKLKDLRYDIGILLSLKSESSENKSWKIR